MANIYDVARRADVSIASVSRVLNCPAKVSPRTRQKIIKAMEDLNFLPSHEASFRARRSMKRIGVLSPYFTHYSFIQRMRGISSALAGTEYEMVVYTVENKEQLERYLDMIPVSQRVDGLILLSLPFTEDYGKLFSKYGIPVVSVERDLSVMGISSITIDNIQGGRIAGEYLISQGYRRIGFIGDGGNPHYVFSASSLRLEGFREILEQNNLPVQPELLVQHYSGLDETFNLSVELLSRQNRPDAVFAASDFEALALSKAARDLGLGIPEDIGILGFDNIEVTHFLDLSTIDQHLDESGFTAAEILISCIEDAARPSRTIQLSLDICERNSTRKFQNSSLRE